MTLVEWLFSMTVQQGREGGGPGEPQHVRQRHGERSDAAGVEQSVQEGGEVLGRDRPARVQGRGSIESMHSTDAVFRRGEQRVCISIHREGKSCSVIGSSALSQCPSGDIGAL